MMDALVHAMTFATPVLAALASISVRAIPLVGAGVIACALLRRHPAALRHAVWCAVLLGIVLMPVATRVVPTWCIPVQLRHAPATTPERAVARGVTLPAGALDRSAPVARALPAARDILGALAVLAWVAIALLQLVRFAAVHARLARIVRRAGPADDPDWRRTMDDAIASTAMRPVPVRVSAAVAVPIVSGLVRPTVVLPAASGTWSNACRRQVLLHELAHVRRGDLAWLSLARLLAAVLWFHPLVWLALTRLRAEAEQASDDAVLTAGERPSHYARRLLALAASSPIDAPAGGMALFRHGAVRERIEAIVAPDRRRGSPGARSLVALASAAASVVALVAAPGLTPVLAATDGASVIEARILPDHAKAAHVVSVRVHVSPQPFDRRRVRLDRPELEIQNRTGDDVRWVRVRLSTPGVSSDATWARLDLPPHATRWLALPEEQWSNDAPWSQARQIAVGVDDVRFEGEVPDDAVAEPAPVPRVPATPGVERALPRAGAPTSRVAPRHAIPPDVGTPPPDRVAPRRADPSDIDTPPPPAMTSRSAMPPGPGMPPPGLEDTPPVRGVPRASGVPSVGAVPGVAATPRPGAVRRVWFEPRRVRPERDITPSAPEAPAPEAARMRTPGPGTGGSPPPEDGDWLPATVLNPAGAPVVIDEAWTPLTAPEPESDMDRGHDLTFTPSLVLHNVSGRRVVAVRLRFKADRKSHAVTALHESIGPGGTVRVASSRTMWGTPRAMTVQVLGVQFADGGSWGSLDSTIDSREGWIR